jgi:hypothetical protein
MVYVPAGDYTISAKIAIRGDGSGLFGPGRIIQTSIEQPIVEVESAADARLDGLTLIRPDGAQETRFEAVVATGCRDVTLDNLTIVDNRSSAAAIALRECVGGRVRGCRIVNYMRVFVDDRTTSDLYGYAFRCIDGSGIVATYGKRIVIEGNQIVERHLLPTRDVQRQFELGKFVKKNATKGTLVSQKVWDDGSVNNWHQGSAIVVTAPEISNAIQILGNTIENAAQGIDLHADHVIVANNVINNAFIGMKAMHGSRNVLIIGNQFSKNDLWAIGLMPGAASHAASPASGDVQAREANRDGGSIIANNIISDFGYGHAHWIWAEANCFPIRFDTGQEADDPPLSNVVVQGNLVDDTGGEGVLVDGTPTVSPPRYKYAVYVPTGDRAPKNLHFSNNLLHSGTEGVSNIPLDP